MDLEIKAEVQDEVVILYLSGKLMGGVKLNEKFADYLEVGLKNIVIDLDKVNWINANGLGILINWLTKFRNQGGDIKFSRPTQRIQSLFVIVKLTDVFKCYETVAEAVASFNNKGG